MHEAGIAASLLAALREAGLEDGGPPLRVIVRGGHDDPPGFDAALRLHLSAGAPQLDQARLEIVHEPVEATCIDCARPFPALSPATACPACGGSGLVPPRPETVELEVGAPCA